MTMRTIGERLATVEEQVTAIKTSQEEEDGRLEKIEKSLADLNAQLERYKGFLGGIVFVFSCVGVFIKLLPSVSGFFQK